MTFAHVPFAVGLIAAGSLPLYLSASPPISYVGLVLVDGFAKISAPLLGFMAAYFAAANLQNRTYPQLVAVRFKQLCIPAIMWSLIFFGVMIAVGYITSDLSYVRQKFSDLDINSVVGLGRFPLNYPLHYLIDLFECTLILPILAVVLKRFGISIFGGLVGTLVLILVATDLNHNNPGMNIDNVLPRADLFLFFSAGLAAQRVLGSNALDRIRIRRRGILIAVGVVFLAGSLHSRWMVAMDSEIAIWSGFFVSLVVRISGSLLALALLPTMRALARRGLTVDDKLTFRLLCTHAIAFYLLQPLLGWKLAGADAAAAFLIAPFIAVCVAFAVWKTERHMKHYWVPLIQMRQTR